MNHHLIARLEAIRKVLVAQGAAAKTMPSASKGEEREAFVREFLEKVFPPHFRLGSGAITDDKGDRSGQNDIAIELPFFPSFPIPPRDVRLYLAEGIAAVLEVKSDVSMQWSQVESIVKQVKQLTRKFGPGLSIGDFPSDQVPVFAVGYYGFKSIEAVKERLASTPDPSRPEGILVLEPGVFVGPRIQATASWALYGLIEHITNICTRLISTVPNLIEHAK